MYVEAVKLLKNYFCMKLHNHFGCIYVSHTSNTVLLITSFITWYINGEKLSQLRAS